MTKEEFEQLKSTVKQWLFHTGSLDPTDYVNELKLKFIEPREKRIAELEEKISVLLSCENCPENKDGLICRKEYENKCLAQKIQFIKELQQENAELKARLNAINQLIPELEKENAELKEKLKPENCLKLLAKEGYIKFTSDQLTKAKEIIEELYNIIPASMSDYAKEPMEHARKFMTEE